MPAKFPTIRYNTYSTVAMGSMVDNHTLALGWLSTVNPRLLCYNYNWYPMWECLQEVHVMFGSCYSEQSLSTNRKKL